jgi:hypothetical protein
MPDGNTQSRELVDIVKGYVARTLLPFSERLGVLEVRLAELPAPKDGKDGVNGKDGKDGENGMNGKDGVNGKDGKDGENGMNGKDGVNGKDGESVQGPPGENGKDGVNGKDADYAEFATLLLSRLKELEVA